jgi:hypothetical protein
MKLLYAVLLSIVLTFLFAPLVLSLVLPSTASDAVVILSQVAVFFLILMLVRRVSA